VTGGRDPRRSEQSRSAIEEAIQHLGLEQHLSIHTTNACQAMYPGMPNAMLNQGGKNGGINATPAKNENHHRRRMSGTILTPQYAQMTIATHNAACPDQHPSNQLSHPVNQLTIVRIAQSPADITNAGKKSFF
jgi:hypothetical protein